MRPAKQELLSQSRKYPSTVCPIPPKVNHMLTIDNNPVKHTLYKWQKDCLEAWRQNQHRGIVNVVTGAGKTWLACAAIEYLQSIQKGLRVRIVVPTIALAQQWHHELLSYFGEDLQEAPGFYYGAMKSSTDLSCLIYVINTARDCLSWHIENDLHSSHPVFLICDECHHYTSRENRHIFDFLTQHIQFSDTFSCLGLSATPFEAEEPSILTEKLGQEIFRFQTTDALAAGTVSPFIIGTVAASFLTGEAFEYQKISESIGIQYARLLDAFPFLKNLDPAVQIKAIRRLAADADMDPSDPAAAYLLLLYQRREISLLADARIQCVQELIGSLHISAKILVFSERIEQAHSLFIRLSEQYPHGCGIYHSQMSKDVRKSTLQAFREGHIRILVTCRCLDEGLDVPDADIGIIMSSSSVSRQRIQRLGRIIRKKEAGAYALLYYLYIYNSNDDSAYLPGLENMPSFSLRYYSSDHLFSNPVYEEAALDLIRKTEEKAAVKENKAALSKELLRCILEGAALADYLLPAETLRRLSKNALNQHEKNYYLTQLAIGNLTVSEKGQGPLE